MKKLVKILSLVMAIIISVSMFAGCGKSKEVADDVDLASMSWDEIVEEAKKTKKVVFSAWWGEEYFKPAIEEFTKEYGIEVELVKADGTEVANKLLAEQSGTSSIDCFLFGGESVTIIMNSDLAYGPINTLLPEADKLDPNLFSVQEGVSTNGYLAPLYRNQTGLLYDPKVVSNPPQTWEELEQFIKDNPLQFGFCDPSKGGSGQAFTQTVITNISGTPERYIGDTELDESKIEDWDKAWEWLNENKDICTITTSNKDSISRLNQGELSLVVAWDDDTNVAHNNGEIFKDAVIYVPEMGMPGGGDTLGIAKNSPNKAAALLLISFLTSAEQQIKLNETLGSYVARTDLEGKATNTLLTTEDMARTSSWYPAPYKVRYIADFTKRVLMG